LTRHIGSVGKGCPDLMALHSLCDERAEGDRQALPTANDLKRHVEDVLRGDCRRQIFHRTNSGEVPAWRAGRLASVSRNRSRLHRLALRCVFLPFPHASRRAALCFSERKDHLNILAWDERAGSPRAQGTKVRL